MPRLLTDKLELPNKLTMLEDTLLGILACRKRHLYRYLLNHPTYRLRRNIRACPPAYPTTTQLHALGGSSILPGSLSTGILVHVDLDVFGNLSIILSGVRPSNQTKSNVESTLRSKTLTHPLSPSPLAEVIT
jgi:hypothetical protein